MTSFDTSICSPESADSGRASPAPEVLHAPDTARSTPLPTAAAAHCSIQTENSVTVTVVEAIGRRIAAADAELRGVRDGA